MLSKTDLKYHCLEIYTFGCQETKKMDDMVPKVTNDTELQYWHQRIFQRENKNISNKVSVKVALETS